MFSTRRSRKGNTALRMYSYFGKGLAFSVLATLEENARTVCLVRRILRPWNCLSRISPPRLLACSASEEA